METKQRGSSKQFQYTGERLRQFLQHNGISYKEAASILSIDKNTVGKAVRGGNLNVDILLHICNVFQMDVTDFFCCEITDKDGLPRNYYITLQDQRFTGHKDRIHKNDNNLLKYFMC